MIRRCLAPFLLAALALASAAATAQFRTIPPEAKRGSLSHITGMTMKLDGRVVDLAAGGQIRDGRNMVVLPTAVPPDMLVKYTLDPSGKLHRVWILSPQEAAQPDPKK
jgi:hypothetical protein